MRYLVPMDEFNETAFTWGKLYAVVGEEKILNIDTVSIIDDTGTSQSGYVSWRWLEIEL